MGHRRRDLWGVQAAEGEPPPGGPDACASRRSPAVSRTATVRTARVCARGGISPPPALGPHTSGHVSGGMQRRGSRWLIDVHIIPAPRAHADSRHMAVVARRHGARWRDAVPHNIAASQAASADTRSSNIAEPRSALQGRLCGDRRKGAPNSLNGQARVSLAGCRPPRGACLG